MICVSRWREWGAWWIIPAAGAGHERCAGGRGCTVSQQLRCSTQEPNLLSAKSKCMPFPATALPHLKHASFLQRLACGDRNQSGFWDPCLSCPCCRAGRGEGGRRRHQRARHLLWSLHEPSVSPGQDPGKDPKPGMWLQHLEGRTASR